MELDYQELPEETTCSVTFTRAELDAQDAPSIEAALAAYLADKRKNQKALAD